MKEAIEWYDQGNITRHEFPIKVCAWAAAEEIPEFVTACPPDLMESLLKYLDAHGPDERKWPRVFYAACYAPWVTADEIEEARWEEQETIWAGVRLLKEHLPKGA
jgi:hypothetical protein